MFFDRDRWLINSTKRELRSLRRTFSTDLPINWLTITGAVCLLLMGLGLPFVIIQAALGLTLIGIELLGVIGRSLAFLFALLLIVGVVREWLDARLYRRLQTAGRIRKFHHFGEYATMRYVSPQDLLAVVAVESGFYYDPRSLFARHPAIVDEYLLNPLVVEGFERRSSTDTAVSMRAERKLEYEARQTIEQIRLAEEQTDQTLVK